MKFFSKSFKKRSSRQDHQERLSNSSEEQEYLQLSLDANIQKVKEKVGPSDDIIIREIKIGNDGYLRACLIFTEGLVDQHSMQNFILETLMIDLKEIDREKINLKRRHLLTFLKENILTVGSANEIETIESLFVSLFSGNAILLFDGYDYGLSIPMDGWESVGVIEATSEPTVRGPKESLTESVRTNTSLIRRKLNTPKLWFETVRIGTLTRTKVTIGYIKGVANDKIVEEARRRLNRIEIDGILETGYIEELIQDKTYTPFPTTFITERPDVIAANLLEGRIVFLVDGTPQAIIVPALFVQFFQTPDDYYARSDISTAVRALRFIGFAIALLAPSLYIAVTTFHQEMLPTPLLISLAAQREGVPFPAFVEAVMMELTFEILREAGLRMPRVVGQALSIVGTLVIGTAAVEAGIVSAAMVIVVSITAISSFLFSSFNLSISVRLLRFPFMALAASFGLFGIFVGLVGLFLHLCSLRSFGIPYMTPIAPFIIEDQKDTYFRFPRWALTSRPRLISQKNIVREDTPAPKPPNNDRNKK